MPFTQRIQTRVVRTIGEDISEIESQVNSILSGISSDNVESVDISPIYSTILENTILQGYIGVITYKTSV